VASGDDSTTRGRLRRARFGVKLLISSMLPSQPQSAEREADLLWETLRAKKASHHKALFERIAKSGVVSYATSMPNRDSATETPHNSGQPRPGFDCVFSCHYCILCDYDFQNVPGKGYVRDCQPQVEIAGSGDLPISDLVLLVCQSFETRIFQLFVEYAHFRTVSRVIDKKRPLPLLRD